MRGIDFTSFNSIITGLIGLALVTLIGMGVRLVMMMTIQQRRERLNRQINERLRTLIAAYKTLGGSFTGDLAVDPRHLRDIRRASTPAREEPPSADEDAAESIDAVIDASASDRDFSRTRRIRDAVEAALADIILLGTEDQVRLAERAARELVAGRPVHVHDLVVSLRSFIRDALDLDPIPTDLDIPHQGPVRPSGSSGGKSAGGRSGGDNERGGAGKGGGMGMGAGMGAGAGMGGAGALFGGPHSTEEDDHH